MYTYGRFMLIYRQKPAQHCNAIIHQLKININFKKKKIRMNQILFNKRLCLYI